MNADMIAALRELEREKGIAFETILAGLEEAMAAAYKAPGSRRTPPPTTTSWVSAPRSIPRPVIFGCSARSSTRSRSPMRTASPPS